MRPNTDSFRKLPPADKRRPSDPIRSPTDNKLSLCSKARRPVQLPGISRASKEKGHEPTRGAKDSYGRMLSDLNGIKRRLIDVEKGYRAYLYQLIAEACDLGQQLQKKPKLWLRFCNEDVWAGLRRKPSRQKPHEAVRYALIWICGTGRRVVGDPSLYWRAVRSLLADGVTPEELPKALQNSEVTINGKKLRGLKALASRNAKRENRGKTASLDIAPSARREAKPLKASQAHLNTKRTGDSTPLMNHKDKSRSRAFGDKCDVSFDVTLKPNATKFLSLPTPCNLKMDVTIDSLVGRRQMTIHAFEIENK